MTLRNLALKRYIKLFCFVLIFFLSLYGASRLYYGVTGGFTISNISSNLSFDKRWDINALTSEKKEALHQILKQKFSYLGKGCQSYVFLSEDKKYVIKFFKYQRFRPQAWLDYLSFIPAVNTYRLEKIAQKKLKLEGIFKSWTIAFRNLPVQTGLIYVHLNKSQDLDQTILISDKMGFDHHLQADQMEFLIQRTAKMLCPTIKDLVKNDESDKAKQLIDDLVVMLIDEYQNGYADNDHALMQNTGVIDGKPIHIDVGQFIKNDLVKNPEVYKKELYNKTFLFKKWLNKNHPELAKHLELKLLDVIGEQLFSMEPYRHKGDVGKIPNET